MTTGNAWKHELIVITLIQQYEHRKDNQLRCKTQN